MIYSNIAPTNQVRQLIQIIDKL